MTILQGETYSTSHRTDREEQQPIVPVQSTTLGALLVAALWALPSESTTQGLLLYLRKVYQRPP